MDAPYNQGQDQRPGAADAENRTDRDCLADIERLVGAEQQHHRQKIPERLPRLSPHAQIGAGEQRGCGGGDRGADASGAKQPETAEQRAAENDEGQQQRQAPPHRPGGVADAGQQGAEGGERIFRPVQPKTEADRY
ncbi:MAG: hypothetical protein WDN04_06010 [Rhodospirillales bacterium]